MTAPQHRGRTTRQYTLKMGRHRAILKVKLSLHETFMSVDISQVSLARWCLTTYTSRVYNTKTCTTNKARVEPRHAVSRARASK